MLLDKNEYAAPRILDHLLFNNDDAIALAEILPMDRSAHSDGIIEQLPSHEWPNCTAMALAVVERVKGTYLLCEEHYRLFLVERDE